MMCPSRDSDGTIRSLSKPQKMIVSYIEEEVDDVEHLKAKNIAEEIEELSPTQIGTNMPRISNQVDDFEISKWGYSSGNTWRVERVAGTND